ncbi:hypothetical protein VpasPP24_75 [Vibrio phage Vpas_PP24]|nr:hypothetical protein VpasPP24_75 [Vibrio phage Vpas_PP24]
MNPETKQKYWAYGLLKSNNPYHHEILNTLERYTINGVQPEYIYKNRLTEYLPKDHEVCKVAVNIRKLRANTRGTIINLPLSGKGYDISQAFAGTMIRNQLQSIVMPLDIALRELKENGLRPAAVYVLTYPTRYNGHVTDYNRVSLFDLFVWAESKGVYLCIINDSANSGSFSFTDDESGYLASRFFPVGEIQ